VCWSAQADLVAGTAIAGLGLLCLARVRRSGDLPLAALPLVLGVHQLIEAAVWLGADGRLAAGPAQWARTAWAVIALPLLPVLVPLGVLRAAGPGGGRRPLLTALLALGTVVAAFLTAALVAHPVGVRVHQHTLTYAVGIPYAPVLLVGYLAATLGPLLLGGDRLLRRLGVLLGLAALLCGLLWRLAFASAWCALAALLTLGLLHWVRRPERP
jgi:hypothetical protein